MKLKNGKEYKMDPEVKKVWVKGLLCGKYTQIRGNTGYGTFRCALGVAIAEKLTKPCFGVYVPKKFLNPEASKKIGLMNDQNKKSFKIIANWIKRKVTIPWRQVNEKH